MKSAILAGCAALAVGSAAQASVNLGNVMILGDSIAWGDAVTWSGGAWGVGTSTDTPIPGGWRSQFYTDLTGAGVTFKSVGTRTDNSNSILAAAGESANEGWPGYYTSYITNALDGVDPTTGQGPWLSQIATPQVTLLQTGTNDVKDGASPATAVNSVDQLLAKLFKDLPGESVYLGTMTPLTGTFASINSNVEAFNALLPSEIAKYSALGDSIHLVDTYDALATNGQPNASLIYDNIHPNQAGYNALGDTWAAAVESVVVPEPASIGLLAVGAMTVRRRRYA